MTEASTKPTREIYGRLIALDRQLKNEGIENLHDRVTSLIGACICEGIDTGGLIVFVLSKLGFTKRHIGKLLADEAKRPSQTALWCRDPDTRYRPNEPATTGS